MLDLVFRIFVYGCFLALAVVILIRKDRFVDMRKLKKYKLEQDNRTPLDALEFCKRSDLSPSYESLVQTTREALGDFRDIDPEKIYPEDDLFGPLGLGYDDDLACFLEEYKILNENKYWFPSEEISQFSDLFPLILRMNNQSEPVAGGDATRWRS